MKIFIPIVLLLLTLCTVLAQQIPLNHQGYAEYVEVGYIDTLTKEQMLENARAWFKDTYSRHKKTHLTESNHELILAGVSASQPFDYSKGSLVVRNLSFSYTISVHCKNGKYKCIINEIHYNSTRVPGLKKGVDLANNNPFESPKAAKEYEQLWKDFRRQTDQEIRMLLKSLREYMQNPTPTPK